MNLSLYPEIQRSWGLRDLASFPPLPLFLPCRFSRFFLLCIFSFKIDPCGNWVSVSANPDVSTALLKGNLGPQGALAL